MKLPVSQKDLENYLLQQNNTQVLRLVLHRKSILSNPQDPHKHTSKMHHHSPKYFKEVFGE